MQAIHESNEHLKKAVEAFGKVKEPDFETVAYHEANLALVKGYQAMAHALLAVANALLADTLTATEDEPLG